MSSLPIESARSPAQRAVLLGDSQHRADIEGLRGIAVLSVFAVHSVPHALRGGFVGVDVFFVLSGYLIATLTLRDLDAGDFRITSFYARRARRLLPALLLVLWACLAFAAWFAFPKDAMEIGRHVAAGAAFVSNLQLWREAGYFDPSSEHKPLLHLWSLGIEEQFYLLWPLAALLLARWRRHALPLIGLLTLASFALNVAMVGIKPKGTFFLPPTRFWELLIGVLLACWSHRAAGDPLAPLLARWPALARRAHTLPNACALVGIGLLVAALWLTTSTDRFPGWWALLPTVATVLMLAAGMRAWVNRVVLAHPVLGFYGRISYPLYLWHWPLLTAPVLLARPLDPSELVLLLCLAVALASATYYAVERPLRFGALAPRAALPLWLLTIATGLAGAWLCLSEGLLQRYPEALRPVAEVQVRGDYEAYRVGRCFLRSEQGPEAFAEDCVDAAPRGAALWLLWGDSHAAALYPGLRRELGSLPQPPRLAQYTAAACPPLPELAQADNPHCNDVRSYMLERIAQLRPARVVLAANWLHYAPQLPGMSLGEGLEQTIAALRRLGVRDIAVVGPLPHWTHSPAQILLAAARRGEPLPSRQAAELDLDKLIADRELAGAALAAGARYASAFDALCEQEGCLVSVSAGGRTEATAFDESHLTQAGSRWLIARMRSALGF